jgi:hypothetical protein
MGIIPTPLAATLFITAIVTSRILAERGMRKLSTVDKGRLVEAFSSFRMVALIPIAAMAALYFAVMQVDGLSLGTMLAIYLPASLLFAIGANVFVYRKLHALALDPEYIRSYVIGRSLVFGALAVMFLAI